jgi:hypothetical protein
MENIPISNEDIMGYSMTDMEIFFGKWDMTPTFLDLSLSGNAVGCSPIYGLDGLVQFLVERWALDATVVIGNNRKQSETIENNIQTL